MRLCLASSAASVDVNANESRPYLREVEEFFVATIRRGLVLRPADVEAAKEWEGRGIPLDVVRRGILLGVRRFLESAEPHEPVPASLRYYRRRVEDEFKAWQRAVGRGLVIPLPRGEGQRDLRAAATAFLQARGAEASGEERAALGRCAARLAAMAPGDALHAVLLELDEILVIACLACVPTDLRAAIEARARALADDARRRGLGPQAVAEVEKSALRALAVSQAGFRGIVDAVLGT